MLNYDSGSRLVACQGLLQPWCRFAGDECKMVNATSEQLYNHIVNPHVMHNILQPYGSVSWPWNMSLKFGGSPNKIILFIYYSHIQVDTWKFGWSCIHGTIHMNHYSSWYYSLQTLFIGVLSLKKHRHYSQYSHYSYQHFSLFVPASISSHEGMIVGAHVIW